MELYDRLTLGSSKLSSRRKITYDFKRSDLIWKGRETDRLEMHQYPNIDYLAESDIRGSFFPQSDALIHIVRYMVHSFHSIIRLLSADRTRLGANVGLEKKNGLVHL